MKTSTNISYEWTTSRGAVAMSFNDEQKARDWKQAQIEKWKDKVVITVLLKVTTTVTKEQLS